MNNKNNNDNNKRQNIKLSNDIKKIKKINGKKIKPKKEEEKRRRE